LIDELIATDLSQRVTGGVGDVVVLANRRDGVPATFRPYGQNILVSGPSGAGKSTFATGLIERLIDRDYQICIVDPEGDYGTSGRDRDDGKSASAAARRRGPRPVGHGRANVVVNLLGIALDDRPDFFAQLLPRLQALRARTGGPDWILIDEGSSLLPAQWGQATYMLPQRLGETILITHRPSEVAPAILAMMDTAVAVGPSPALTLGEFAKTLALEPPPFHPPGATRRSSGSEAPGSIPTPRSSSSAVGPASSPAEIRRGKPGPPELLLPGCRGADESARPEPHGVL
jgi:hypothetical protein